MIAQAQAASSALLRFLLVSLNVLPGPGGGGRSLSSSVARLGGMPPRMEVAREAAERVAARVLVRRDIFFFVFCDYRYRKRNLLQ